MPVKLTKKAPISHSSSVYGNRTDEFSGIRSVTFSARTVCWDNSCDACTELDNHRDIRHANTIFLRHDFIIHFLVFNYFRRAQYIRKIRAALRQVKNMVCRPAHRFFS